MATMTIKKIENQPKRRVTAITRFERFARSTAIMAGRPVAFLIAVAIVLVWLATGPISHFSDTWQLIINTGTTIVTFLMVFLIQHSQNRDAMAVQVKLAELIVAGTRAQCARNRRRSFGSRADTIAPGFFQESGTGAETAGRQTPEESHSQSRASSGRKRSPCRELIPASLTRKPMPSKVEPASAGGFGEVLFAVPAGRVPSGPFFPRQARRRVRRHRRL
jgi:hypothetical protein